MFSPNETNGDIYVVRKPETKFVNDSDSNYLEFRYPSFGRAGTNEKERIQISRNGLLAYMVNLSPRQFQEVDFVLPVYDMITTEHSAIQHLVIALGPELSTKASFALYCFITMQINVAVL